MLALPLLLIPDQLIEGWVGDGYSESAPVLALLALVVLVHQPIYLFTQYLIARGRQRQIARTLIVAVSVNVVLSVALASWVGIWGVALSTLVTDVGILLYVAAGTRRTRRVDPAWRRLREPRSGRSCPHS